MRVFAYIVLLCLAVLVGMYLDSLTSSAINDLDERLGRLERIEEYRTVEAFKNYLRSQQQLHIQTDKENNNDRGT